MASENGSRLQQVGQDRIIPSTETAAQSTSPPTLTHPYAPLLDKAATEALLLGLKALSQRTLVALGNLFTILSVISVFILWYCALPAPNTYQIVLLGIYAAFILLLHLVKRKG